MARFPDRGFTLVEVLIAMGILVAAIGALAQLFAVSARAIRMSQRIAVAAMLADNRLEELETLAWTVRPDGSLLDDRATDLSRQPAAAGGSGLGLSPPGTLDADTPGYVDFLDSAGRWLGASDRAPPGTAFIRRWAVSAPADADGGAAIARTRVLEVVVLLAPGTATAGGARRSGRVVARAVGVRVLTMG